MVRFMISTRYRILLLLLVNIGILLIPKELFFVFVIILLVYNLVFWKDLISNFKLICIYLIGLFVFAGILNFIFTDFNFINLLKDSIKIFTIINISILLLNNINIMELVAFLSKVKVPTKISIAIGVGFRYFSLLVDDIKNINFILKVNNYGISIKSFRKNGIFKSLNAFLLPIFLSIIRRTENISVSISLQDVENRAYYYKYSKSTFPEIILTVFTILILTYGIITTKLN